MALLHNITSNTTTQLLGAGENVSPRSISLANVQGTHAVDVDLFISNGTKNYYIIKGTTIPVGVTLVLDDDNVSFNNTSTGFSLYIKLLGASSSTGNVDVIIKR
mgnify:CR=1 FL=1|tara:strand:- start:51 stop:362 length:312 start_codon:yes stop_codon:yes gene_type:complete